MKHIAAPTLILKTKCILLSAKTKRLRQNVNAPEANYEAELCINAL